jgi:hypothetical protein
MPAALAPRGVYGPGGWCGGEYGSSQDQEESWERGQVVAWSSGRGLRSSGERK